ncbi:hypothetical protein NUW54_g9872 [Trametes sanguinea]|uniref:Uncharacterized protein n=1 Tax=Trametes sanguinea TaxID=158606 RepID=A0ACC1P4A5_9APHY|nr:hypothetical protein NUW54_g9872 [Trametes sanguinea]
MGGHAISRSKRYVLPTTCRTGKLTAYRYREPPLIISLRQFYEHECRRPTPHTTQSAPLSATPSSAAAPNNVNVPGPYRAILIALQATSVRRASVCKESSARPSLFSHRRYLAHDVSVSVLTAYSIYARMDENGHDLLPHPDGSVRTDKCSDGALGPMQTYRSVLLREGTGPTPYATTELRTSWLCAPALCRSCRPPGRPAGKASSL